MQTSDAYEMGLRSARPGLLFDTMEMVAALSVSLGGFDTLESFVRTLADLQRETGADVEWITELASAAFKTPLQLPVGVDAYRTFLTTRIFEIVNRWSYIEDIHTVSRLQAWFYCGFGLGRGLTVLRGLRYFDDLRETTGIVAPLDQMPKQLGRMAQEAARQLQTVSEEDDFSAIESILMRASHTLDGYALRCANDAASLTIPAHLRDDTQYFEELIVQRTRESRQGIVQK